MEIPCIAVVSTDTETEHKVWRWFYSSAQVGQYVATIPFFWNQRVECFVDKQEEHKVTKIESGTSYYERTPDTHT